MAVTRKPLARSYLEQGFDLYRRGLPLAALELAERARREIDPDSDPAPAQRSLHLLGALHLDLERHGEAMHCFKRAARLAEHHGLDGTSLVNQSLVLRAEGRFDEALAVIARALESGNLAPAMAGRAYITQSAILIELERWEDALAAAHTARNLLQEAGAEGFLPRVYNNIGLCEARLGHGEAARNHLHEALRLNLARRDIPEAVRNMTELAQLAYQEGALDQALEMGIEALQTLWAHIGLMDRGEVARVSHLFGAILLHAPGDRSLAINCLNRAAAYYSLTGAAGRWQKVSDLLNRALTGGLTGERNLHVRRGVRSQLQRLTGLFTLVETMESTYPHVGAHGRMVTHYALQLGRALGLAGDRLGALAHAGRFHDIGKTVDHEEIGLDRRDIFARPRYRVLRTHPQAGEHILRMFPLPDETLMAVRHHHERWDGLGWPDGLAGGEIPFLARILAVANVYVVLTFDRYPEAPLSHTQAMAELEERAGTYFDPQAVEAFKLLHKE